MMRGLVCFSVFGADSDGIYGHGAIRNAELYSVLRPDWQLRFYTGHSTSEDVKKALMEYPSVEVVEMDEPEAQNSTFWRFEGLKNLSYDFYISRDTDSRPSARELTAVDEWLMSGRDFHVIRDHPRHGTEMLGGLWGVKRHWADKASGLLPDYRTRLKTYSGDRWGDQWWLRHCIWRHARRSLMAHVDCDWHYGTPVYPLAPLEDSGAFIGEGLRADDSPRFPLHRLEKLVSGFQPLEASPYAFRQLRDGKAFLGIQRVKIPPYEL